MKDQLEQEELAYEEELKAVNIYCVCIEYIWFFFLEDLCARS